MVFPSPTSLTLFCKVIDNFGDIGICWRLAQQLEIEHHITVTLWVDDLRSFHQICPDVVIHAETQQINKVTIRHWCDQKGVFSSCDVSDIVIEFFGCELPPSYLRAMAQRAPHPVWLNFEGLSAEKWVEGCHTLPSPHPSLPLTKYFFFPGFTSSTGGLLLESELSQHRQKFQQDPAKIAAFLATLGLTRTEMDATKVSLFCYSHAPITELLTAWENSKTAVTCLAPEGIASEALQQFLASPAKVGASASRGALTVRVIPFLSQPEYDKLLWACDLNFVRGEDSFVRAQWAGRPFIWHIYPQDNNLHHIKLNAFLQILTAKADSLVEFFLMWNMVTNKPLDFATSWPIFHKDIINITGMTEDWQKQLAFNGDLASNIVKFAQTICQRPSQK
ncbi:MAG: hypothetical protein K0R08_151 [Solimicrobium sp.]|jgi:uncharacterized repeat protein (TIGR03837 family)|nr:hypothetical protein [Solimicrobium sp.]